MNTTRSSKMSARKRGYERYDVEAYDSTGLVKTLWVFPYFRRWYVNWINQILPRVPQITLDRNRVFVFPTLQGFAFIISAFCVFLAGTNYANNLLLAMGFLLFSIFIVTIWHSFLNILGLTIKAGNAAPVFLGEHALFKITLKRPGKQKFYAIKLLWPKSLETFVNIDEDQQVHIEVQSYPLARGRFYPPRLTVETRFPFGIIRCWSHVSLETSCVVYPKPLENDIYLGEGQEGQFGEEVNFQNSEDFYELKKFQEGDNLNHVAWKAYSKGMGLRTKTFASYNDDAIWLKWENFESYEYETRLSFLCYWVLAFHNQKRLFGLDLPGVLIEPDFGEEHKSKCLAALALFDEKIDERIDENPGEKVNKKINEQQTVIQSRREG